MKRSVMIEAEYPHPPERVWRALTDREALSEWLLPNDFEPRVGHRFEFRSTPRGDWNGIIECEVTELEEPRRLSYTWRGEANQPHTLVTWTLEPTEVGTRVRIEHQAGEFQCALFLDTLPVEDWQWALGFELPMALSPMNGTLRPSPTLAGIPRPSPRLTLYRCEKSGASLGAARFGVRQSHAAFVSAAPLSPADRRATQQRGARR